MTHPLACMSASRTVDWVRDGELSEAVEASGSQGAISVNPGSCSVPAMPSRSGGFPYFYALSLSFQVLFFRSVLLSRLVVL